MPVSAIPKAAILEIFESRQGEGILVGDPHAFVRFGGCNLACDYCDTPESIPAKSGCEFSVETVLNRLAMLETAASPPVVSLTGGEPLLQVAFLEELLPRLRAQGYKIYLETNGTLPEALRKIVGVCDWIAMDFKPESATGRDLWEAHRWFLEIGVSKAFVKMVLTDVTEETEFRRGVDLILQVHPAIPLVLQPATPQGQTGSIPLPRLMSWWAWAAKSLSDVRIIPQIHRLWGVA